MNVVFIIFVECYITFMVLIDCIFFNLRSTFLHLKVCIDVRAYMVPNDLKVLGSDVILCCFMIVIILIFNVQLVGILT